MKGFKLFKEILEKCQHRMGLQLYRESLIEVVMYVVIENGIKVCEEVRNEIYNLPFGEWTLDNLWNEIMRNTLFKYQIERGLD